MNSNEIPADEADFESKHGDDSGQPFPWQEQAEVERWPRPVHYLFLALCVALCLMNAYADAVSKGFLESRRSGPIIFTLALSAVSSGAALFGFGLFIARYLRGIRFPRYEGEYLLVVTGINYLSFFLFYTLPERFLSSVGSLWVSGGYEFVRIATVFIGSLVMLVCWKRATIPWRVFIILYIVRNILSLTWSFKSQVQTLESDWMLVYLFSMQIPALALACVALCDQARNRELPWTHWLGVGAFLLGSGVTMLPQVGDRVLPYLRALIRSIWF